MVYSCDTRNHFYFELNSNWVLELLNEMGWRETEDYEDKDLMYYCNEIEKEYNSHLNLNRNPLSFLDWFLDNYNNYVEWDNLKLKYCDE